MILDVEDSDNELGVILCGPEYRHLGVGTEIAHTRKHKLNEKSMACANSQIINRMYYLLQLRIVKNQQKFI